MVAGGRVGRDPEKQEQSGAGGCGGKTPALLPGTRKAQGPDPLEAQDIQTERSCRVRALGSLLHPDPHKWGPYPLTTSGVARRWTGPGGSPGWRGRLATACPELTGPQEDTWALTGLHIPERLELELDMVAWVLKSRFSPQVGAREGCLRHLPPTPAPGVAGASTTRFAAGLTLGREPLRTFWWRYVTLECSGIGFL